MAEQQLPLRKFVRVWLKVRKNPPRQNGAQSVSRTLEWVEFGQRRFMSLGAGATAAYARQARSDKEKELNSPESRESLEPVSWTVFRKKYLDTMYPGHDLRAKHRMEAAATWAKSFNTMRSERLALDNFERIVMRAADRDGAWCLEINSADRDKYTSTRIDEVDSGDSVDADLRNLRTIFNVMEEWKDRPTGSNPFAGRKKATVGERRKRIKELKKGKKAQHYTRAQIVALLRQAD